MPMTKPKVAIIGCGPAGMFFLHAVSLRRKQLETEGNTQGLEKLPTVTCFEQASSPGGVWRSDRNQKQKNSGDGVNNYNGSSSSSPSSPSSPSNNTTTTNMYEALWTNGPKECIEFFDYTFDEHFDGCALPMYMPRTLILEYMLARCTKDNKNPSIFDEDHHVKFNTRVQSVTFHEEMGQFLVQTLDLESNSTNEDYFDKCIWAAGSNGIPKIPHAISTVLETGNFKGTVMHSSETGPSFDTIVRGKNVLIIGDSYSAEDLTLQAIKLGVESVEICSRSGIGIAYYTGSWPRDCVDVHYAYTPIGVKGDGKSIILSDGTEEMVLDDIDTVIYCTGYLTNMEMLHPSLRPSMERPYFSEYEIPKDWKMANNSLSKEFGDIPIGTILDPPKHFSIVRHDVYRGQLISNPNIMFFLERIDTPLMDIDVTAWLLLAQITGDIPLPLVNEMKQFNLATLMDAMQDPICRGYADENYKKRWDLIDDEHWTYNLSDKRMKQMSRNSLDLQFRILARDMADANYPLHIGSYNKLNEKGRALVEFNHVCGYARYDLDEESRDASWRTFRDCNPSKCYSIMTGTKAVPLRCRWLDLNGDSKEDIVNKTNGKQKSRGIARMIRDKLRIN